LVKRTFDVRGVLYITSGWERDLDARSLEACSMRPPPGGNRKTLAALEGHPVGL
jgi:hypothetical protein